MWEDAEGKTAEWTSPWIPHPDGGMFRRLMVQVYYNLTPDTDIEKVVTEILEGTERDLRALLKDLADSED